MCCMSFAGLYVPRRLYIPRWDESHSSKRMSHAKNRSPKQRTGVPCQDVHRWVVCPSSC
ncbi:hypothetical protein C0J52_08425 [Blattella germanica]|nr:hypothetical protein C0J52_08425 [Blattella germanica]